MQIEKGQVWSSIQGGKVKVQEVTKSTVTFKWLAGEPYLSYRLIGEFLESFERVDDSKRLHKSTPRSDAINHPEHYISHPSGIECIEVTRHMSFNAGNVIKYLWRNGLKDGEPSLKDLKKAAWYLNDMIDQLETGG